VRAATLPVSTPEGERALIAPALIAVDLGAESCRVSLLSWRHGRAQIELIHRFGNAPEQRADGLRWNLDRIIAGVDEGLHQCAAIADEGVGSIAVDGWAVDYVRLHTDGSTMGAMEDPFCYRDPRCARALQALHGRIASERLRALTGIQVQPLNTVYQLHADALSGAEQSRWLNLPEYLLHHWGGAPVAERTNVTHTGLVGLDGNWCEEIFEAAGIASGNAPRIVEPGTETGEYRGAVTRLHGAKLIAPCCHDTASAVAGIPAEGENWAYISSGTWSLVGTVLAQPCNTADAARANFTNLGAAGGRVLFHKGIPGMWLLKQCMEAWNLHDVAWLIGKARVAAPSQSNELIDIEDPGLAVPGDMPARINMQRAERGLAAIEDAPKMTRLVFDSLAARYAQVLRAMEQITGKKLERIYIVGGGSQNELLNQLTAQATGLPVVRGSVESSTIGNFAVQLAAAEGDASAASVARWAARLSAVPA
jgi:rhamnulokinase